MDKEPTDYCGPYGDHPLIKAISKAIPDVLFGIDLSDCCKQHDEDILTHGPRKVDDIKFRSCVKCKIIKTVKSHKVASFISYLYYFGGRLGAARYR